MARYRSWRCPDCDGVFRFLHHPDDAPPPDRCQLCGAWMSDAEPAFTPQAPAVARPGLVKAVDDVYYGMEDASRARAELMAQQTPGASASDFGHTVITDMNDRQRAGDIAYKAPPPTVVSEMMRRGVGGWQPNAAEYAAAAHQGYNPRAGDMARQQTNALHAQLGQQLIRQAEIGRYMPPKS